jgi:hypothetical protein
MASKTVFTNSPETAIEAINQGKDVFALFQTDTPGKYHAKACELEYVSTLAFETDESNDTGYEDYYSGFLTFAIRQKAKKEHEHDNRS